MIADEEPLDVVADAGMVVEALAGLRIVDHGARREQE